MWKYIVIVLFIIAVVIWIYPQILMKVRGWKLDEIEINSFLRNNKLRRSCVVLDLIYTNHSTMQQPLSLVYTNRLTYIIYNIYL